MMNASGDRASIDSRATWQDFEKEVPISASGLTYADARYSCSTCGSCGAVVLTWGVVSNEMREDLSATAARVVWIMLLLIVLATSGYLVEIVEANLGVMRRDRRDGLSQKYTTARIQCAGLGVVNVLGLLFGLLANESRDSLSTGGVRIGWVCFFVIWLMSTFNYIVTMATTTAAQPVPVGEVTINPTRQLPVSPVRRPPPKPPTRAGPGPVRHSVEGLTALDRHSLDNAESVWDQSAEPSVVLTSIQEERPSGHPHRRSTSQENFVA